MDRRIRMYKKMLNTLVTEHYLITSVTEIIGEILNGLWSDSELISPVYTVGDLRTINGFYTMSWIIQDMVGAMVGRSANLCARQCGIDLADLSIAPHLVESLADLSKLEASVLPKLLERLRKTYGDPVLIDEQAGQRLKQRHEEMFNAIVAHAKQILEP